MTLNDFNSQINRHFILNNNKNFSDCKMIVNFNLLKTINIFLFQYRPRGYYSKFFQIKIKIGLNI